ncbi:MAG: hypothetical protein QW035_00875 [Candidatus Anstonellales archaeon]
MHGVSEERLSPKGQILLRLLYKEGSSQVELEGAVQKGSSMQDAIVSILVQNGYSVSIYSSSIGDYIGDVKKEQDPQLARVSRSSIQPKHSKGGIQFFFKSDSGWALPVSSFNGKEYFFGASEIFVDSPISFLVEKGGFNGEWDKEIDSYAPRAFSKEPCVSCSISSLHTSSFTAFTSSFIEPIYQEMEVSFTTHNSYMQEGKEGMLKLGRYLVRYDGEQKNELKEPEKNFYAYIASNPWVLMFFDVFGKEKGKWKDKGPSNLKEEPAKQEQKKEKKEAKGKESNPPNPIQSKQKKEKRPLSRSVPFSTPLPSSRSPCLSALPC